MPRVGILANPASGRGRGLARARTLVEELARLGIAAACTSTRDAEEVETRARAAAADGIEVLAVAGGDGTLRRAAQGLAGSATALAVIPSGRGNDLVRAIGSPSEPAALAALIAGRRIRAIDLGRSGAAFFVTVATFGFDAAVSALVHRREVPFRGTLSYVAATLKALRRFTPIPVRLEGDFGVLEEPVMMVSTASTPSYGGGMRIAPEARMDDGLLDICVVRPVSTLTLLATLPRIFSGGHVHQRAVTMLRSRSIRIESAAPLEQPLYADGEPMGSAPALLEAVPGALRVVAPGQAAER